jgi:glycosyltransferase involved in cell wall biosynthesis/Tfp pilus assembly protein PilF
LPAVFGYDPTNKRMQGIAAGSGFACVKIIPESKSVGGIVSDAKVANAHSKPRIGRAANAARAKGDEARAQRNWTDAARYYRLHLTSKPSDFAIWVQLGHALKESGQHVAALEAYSEALALNERDADLLVNMGHLLKTMGLQEEASSYYNRGAVLGESSNEDTVLARLSTPQRHKSNAPDSSPPWVTKFALLSQNNQRAISDVLLNIVDVEGRRARRLGDEARSLRNWPEAVRYYSAHLRAQPASFAIWVQLGHAFKESGNLEAALEAYERAYAINESDADLFLSMGHLYKLLGRRDDAIANYRRSAECDGNQHALTELTNLGVRTLIEEPRPFAETPERGLADRLAPLCDGLSPIATSGLVEAQANRLELVSGDPWVLLQLDPTRAAAASLGILTVEATVPEGGVALKGRVYFDHGMGFQEKYCLRFPKNSDVCSRLIAAPKLIKAIRWDPDDKPNLINLPKLSYRPLESIEEARSLIESFAYDQADVDPVVEIAAEALQRSVWQPQEASKATLVLAMADAAVGADYRAWLSQYERVSKKDYETIGRLTATMSYKPTFSFVMPTYNTPANLLRECLDSMLAQRYPHFEICVADDNSPDQHVLEILREYAARDSRIKFVSRPANGHISAASNSALKLATGEFIVLIDHDDLIPDYSLFIVACYLNKHRNADILFSDEDKIDLGGARSDPYFKGNFNKFLMFGHNMVSHLGVYRRSLIDLVGGFRLGLEGSQDYDLFLRCYEHTVDENLIHIPHVLYHWRMTPGSTSVSADQKSYAAIAAVNAVNGYFERTGMPFRSVEGFAPGHQRLAPTRDFDTSLSIIIPTRNGLEYLRPCVASILSNPHENTEIIIVDNGSDDPEILSYMRELEANGSAKILLYPHAFNFSLINNFAAEHASGDYLCFLNNDTEVLEPTWLLRARALLSCDEVGMVGARLLYEDNTLQHFGVATGMGEHGVAGHVHLGIYRDDPGYFSKARLMQEFTAVTAACLFMRKSDFVRIGGFEPELRVNYNDVDLCLKVRALGLKIVGDPDLLLIHKESKTRGKASELEKSELVNREGNWLINRWGADFLLNDPYYSPNHSLQRVDFSFATPPRTPFPWKQPA